jgi:predicted phosphodiesterase
MRIAVISDVHSNVVALDAVLAHVGGVDALWHLGDIVGYGPDPDAVVERLADAGAIGVRGNHDAAAVGGDEIEWFNADARAAMEWTRRAIAPSTLAWLRALPERCVEADFTLVHGSQRSTGRDDDVRGTGQLLAIPTRHGLNGHTHVPIAFTSMAIGWGTSTPATVGAWNWAGRGCCSIQAASANRATATPGPPASSWTWTPAGRSGAGSRTTSMRSGPGCARPGCRSGSASAFAMASEFGA